jgi:D-arabinonate dehydratase
VKITDLAVESYRWPQAAPIRTGQYTFAETRAAVVRVHTDAGLSGIGLLYTSRVPGGEKVIPALAEGLRPAVIGRDPFDVEAIWAGLWQPTLVGRRGLTTRVISAIDIAIWDARARAAGLPLYKLLGGYTDRVPAYIAGGYYAEGKGLRELAQEMEENLALGARAVKIKVGGAPLAEDVERVRVVRETVGPDVKVMVDANCAYAVHEAIQFARRIEDYDVFWFEEPVAPDNYRGSAAVAAATRVPIAAGENEYTRYGFRDLIEARSVAILNPDAQHLGGVTEFMKVAALAQAHDLPIAPHGNQDIHVHLACAIPNGLIVEYYRGNSDPMWGRFFKEHLALHDGCLTPPDRPGLGMEIDEKAAAPFRVG